MHIILNYVLFLLQEFFIESVCDDAEIVKSNIMVSLFISRNKRDPRSCEATTNKQLQIKPRKNST